MTKRFLSRTLATTLSLTFLFALMPSFAQADPVREVTDRSSADDLATTSTVNLKYTRTTNAVLVCQSYLLIEPPNAVATMLLSVGGNGRPGVADGTIGVRNTNFLFRNRYEFAASGPFNVAVIDAPFEDLASINDVCSGIPSELRRLSRVFRFTAPHLEDIETVIADLRSNVSGSLPIYVASTGRGAVSAGSAAAHITGNNALDGLVLLASVTIDVVGGGAFPTLLDVPLENISIPSLVASHRDDACPQTPPNDVQTIQKRLQAGGASVQIRFFAGGLAPLSDECGSLVEHGFFGIDSKVVKFIANWIR